jgi:hypothetical protein
VLVAGYHRLMAGVPADSIYLHVAVRRADGLIVYDACPDVQTFEAFSTSAEFRETVAAAGLPEPHVEALGEIESTVLRAVAT